MLPERGGDQGDYRAGIRAKINNAIECLKTEPLSKRAVSADSCAASHVFCLIMSADNPDPVQLAGQRDCGLEKSGRSQVLPR